MAVTSLCNNIIISTNSFDRRLGYLLSNSQIFHKQTSYGGARNRRFSYSRVYSKSHVEELKPRKCSPILESTLLSNDKVLSTGDWKVVPDIWRSITEKYGDRTALLDPYHDPPSEITYKQLEQDILDFCEGLRVVGVEPDEKIALFADNSCRWLIADQ
ncbi:hypothetical protein MKW94_005507, partial [Papaver nudicaule]|nr:hypothetical protein [Papaver nudicaule]